MRYVFEMLVKIIKRIFSLWKLFWWKVAYRSGFKCGKSTFFYPGCHVMVEHTGKLRIGSNCFFNHDCSINCLCEIQVGNDCIFGENVRLYDHNHNFDLNHGLFREQPYTVGKLVIGNNCWIGSNVTILSNVTIGNNVVIGAGTIVVKSVPDNTFLIDKLNLESKIIK